MSRIRSLLYTHYKKVSLNAVRWFGWLLLSFCLTGVVMSHGRSLYWWLILVSVLPGIIVPVYWRLLYALLMVLLTPVGNVVSFITLGLVYYLIITPVGLLRGKRQKAGWFASEWPIDPGKMHE